MAFGLKGGRGGIPGFGAIATGDFNNDGAVDLVATNSANGEVSIFLNDADEILFSIIPTARHLERQVVIQSEHIFERLAGELAND